MEKLWNVGFVYLLCLNALSSAAFHMAAPVVSLYVVSLGGSLTLGGTVVGVFALTALVVRPFSGALSDRMNKKHLIVVSTALGAVFAICYSLGSSIPVLIVARILHGAAFAISSTTIIAFASTFIPMSRMGEGVGFLGIGLIIAITIGPMIGLMVAESFDFLAVFTLSSIVTALSAIFMALIRYKNVKTDNRKREFKFQLSDFIELKLVPFAVISMLFASANGFIQSFIALLGDERKIAEVGIYFLVSSATLVVIRPLSGRLNDRKGLPPVLIPALVLSAIAMTMLANAGSLWIIVLAAIIHATGHGSGQPALQAEGIRRLPDKRGVATSTFFVGLDAGQGLGPIVGGAVLSAYGFSTVFYGIAAVLILGMLGFVVLFRQPKGA